jgi:integrase
MHQASDPEQQRRLRRPFPTPPSSKEIAALLKEASKEPKAVDVRDVVNILCKTGMRRGELRGLRWLDVDFEEKAITITSSRNGMVRRVPVGEGVLEILRGRRERQPGSDYVLGASPHTVLDRVARLLRILSVRIVGRPLNLHSFRHAFGMHWVRLGGDLGSLAFVMGHTSVLTTIRDFRSPAERFRLAARHLARFEGAE